MPIRSLFIFLLVFLCSPTVFAQQSNLSASESHLYAMVSEQMTDNQRGAFLSFRNSQKRQAYLEEIGVLKVEKRRKTAPEKPTREIRVSATKPPVPAPRAASHLAPHLRNRDPVRKVITVLVFHDRGVITRRQFEREKNLILDQAVGNSQSSFR